MIELLVPGTGIEPVQPCGRGILSRRMRGIIPDAYAVRCCRDWRSVYLDLPRITAFYLSWWSKIGAKNGIILGERSIQYDLRVQCSGRR